MSKVKKILAIVLSMVMVLAMSMTVFAEGTGNTSESEITVNGLAAGTETTVKVYTLVTLDAGKSTWSIVEWAKEYINEATNPLTFDWEKLGKAAENQDPSQTLKTTDTSITITVNQIGAYLILASDEKATYTVMGTGTYQYDNENSLIAPLDQTVNAKATGFEVDKTADAGDNFVAKGQMIDFTITSTFPTWQNTDSSRTYSITDTPTGLNIDTESIKVTVGGDVVEASNYVVDENNDTGVVTIEFTADYIGENNDHAGKTVEVNLKAEVTTDEGYSNTANVAKDNIDQDSTPPKVVAYQGDITITKYAEDEATKLNGAEFNVYKDNDTTPLQFVYVEEGVYTLPTTADENTDTKIVATNGTVQIKGLDEGTYHFKEIKAPAGYSINETGVTVEITEAEAEGATANISKTGSLTDTKLSALPSTGGIGTTIFTIVGCLIMIAAATIFFVSRRRVEK